MNNSLAQSELRRRFLAIEPLLNAIAVIILATIFLFWNVSRAAYVLLALAALVVVVRYRPRMPADQRLYSWPIIGYVGATALSIVMAGFSDSGLNNLVSRSFLLLMAIPLVSIFYLSFTLKRNVWIKFAIGCMVMGVQALVDILVLNESRANGEYNAAAFGFTALAMTSIVIASYYRFNQVRFGWAVFFLAILLGVCAMILSGTRTSWLAGLAILVIAMIFYPNRYSIFKRVLLAMTLIVTIVIVSSSLPIVQKRIDNMIEIVTPYVKGEDQTEFNSLRIRVELWKLGWRMGMDNKIFGFGNGNIRTEIRDYAEKYPHLEELETKVHIHNQFIQTFAMTGLVGLFSLLVLFVCHFWIFAKYLGKQYSLEVRCLALAGFLLMVSYLLKSIPGVPFYGKQYLLMYGFSSAVIWGSLLGALRDSDETEAFSAPLASNEPV